MPWRRSLGQALGRVSIFLVQKIETGASQNESHHHFEMSIISVIYHIEKIIIPLEKRTDFEMTLEIIIIIISKRKSYLILAEGQHDGTSPAYTWSMLQASDFRVRNTIYRYNGSVHRWIVVRQGFSLPIKSRNFRAWFKYWKIYPSKYFFSRVFHGSNDEPTCHRSGVLPQIFVNNLKLKSATQPATFRQLCKSDLFRYTSSSLDKPLSKIPLLPVLMV